MLLHDELVIECNRNDQQEVVNILKDNMETIEVVKMKKGKPVINEYHFEINVKVCEKMGELK